MSKHNIIKKFIAAGLTLALTFGITQPVSAVTDIKGHWAEKIINLAIANSVMRGNPDGTFMPDNYITREEFFMAITNIMTDKPDTSQVEIPFSDVKEDGWYVDCVKIALAAGLTKGIGGDLFGIGRNITREEAAKIVSEIVHTENLTGSGSKMAKDEGKISSWAKKGVDIMYKKGYIAGDEQGFFNPQAPLTRASAAKILLEVKKNEHIISPMADKTMKGEFVKGNGTKENPYQITNSAQLNNVRNFADKKAYFVLKNDIIIDRDYAKNKPMKKEKDKMVEDMRKTDWTKGNFEPIGDKEKPFNGCLIGDGYKISGLDIRGLAGREDYTPGLERHSAPDYVGLFGAISKEGKIENLSIDNSRFEGRRCVGAFAGELEGKITKQSRVSGNVIIKASSKAGGFAGEVTGSAVLENLENSGNIYGSDGVGGIVGSLEGQVIVRDCTNKGIVETKGYNAGGIVGKSELGNKNKITGCINTGYIKGSGVNGGIIGKSVNLSVDTCINEGKVEGNGAGGIAGEISAEVTNCTNTGHINGNFAGGIAATAKEDALIHLCYNEGEVRGKGNVGGIAGENLNALLKDIYNKGSVTGDIRVGGLVGKNTGKIQYAYNIGSVKGSVAGGVIGDNLGRIKNVFWLEGKATKGFGKSTVKETLWEPYIVTEKELSGQIKVDNGDRTYFMVLDKLKEGGAPWKYLYVATDTGKEDSSEIISDGGGIVAPIVHTETNREGNTISETDILGGTYLYPVF